MPVKLEHRLGVQAPAEVIWEVLSDLGRWDEWCPLYGAASGTIRIGEVLTMTLKLPGQKPGVIRPVVLDWVPHEQLHWRLSMANGLVRTVRYFEIEKMSEDGAIFSNGEMFGGLLGGFVARQMRTSIRGGFEAMGEALRDRAEALWRERGASAK